MSPDSFSPRPLCLTCRKSASTCYCSRIRAFDAAPEFVILIHPKENRKRVGTGRLTHLCLSNSVLLSGVDFTRNEAVSRILADPGNWPVVLYPGPAAIDVSRGAAATFEELVPRGKKLVVFVLDGSWSCAKKMLRVSANLRQLPQIRFDPPHRSTYRIRRQPRDICFSTVEAVHFMIDQLGASERWKSGAGHENLLEVFRHLVERQLSHVAGPGQRAARGDRRSPL